MSGKDESMQEGREEREKTTVRMCRRFPSTGHTDVALALLSQQEKHSILNLFHCFRLIQSHFD